MSEVRFIRVVKRFDEVVALRGLDLDVPDGAFVVLLGPSGCGKTTALRILAGLELPSDGRVEIGGRDVTRVQPRDRDVAMVFQSYALYPHMTVEQNIAYPLRIRGLSREQRADAVRKVAEALEVGHLLKRRPRQLSGGQRQRIALARAIVREPAVFLMDEPLSNLDAKLRTSMRGEIKRLQKRLATTTLYVTHDQAEAMTMADLVAVMSEGDLRQLAVPNELYDRPADRFVATFVGNPPMNVLPVAVDADAGALAVGGGRVAAPGDLLEACAERDVCELGIRAEDVQLTEPGSPGALDGEVYVVEPMGNETLVEVRLGDSRLTARAEHGFDAPIGAGVGVVLHPLSACFFDRGGIAAIQRSDRQHTRKEEASV
jgi:multiple sugar transport system ATP-binding protein